MIERKAHGCLVTPQRLRSLLKGLALGPPEMQDTATAPLWGLWDLQDPPWPWKVLPPHLAQKPAPTGSGPGRGPSVPPFSLSLLGRTAVRSKSL